MVDTIHILPITVGGVPRTLTTKRTDEAERLEARAKAIRAKSE